MEDDTTIADENAPENTKTREPGRVGRPESGTPDWSIVFLLSVLSGYHITEAAEQACVSLPTVYRRRHDDKIFRKAWEKASRIGTKALEAEAQRRAFHGVEEPVFHKGIECGRIRRYSDALIQFLLKSRKPKRYRENAKFELTGKDGKDLGPTIIYLPDNGRAAHVADEGRTTEEAEVTPDQVIE